MNKRLQSFRSLQKDSLTISSWMIKNITSRLVQHQKKKKKLNQFSFRSIFWRSWEAEEDRKDVAHTIKQQRIFTQASKGLIKNRKWFRRIFIMFSEEMLLVFDVPLLFDSNFNFFNSSFRKFDIEETLLWHGISHSGCHKCMHSHSRSTPRNQSTARDNI